MTEQQICDCVLARDQIVDVWTQGYAIAADEMTISRDEFQRKFGDPATGHAE